MQIVIRPKLGERIAIEESRSAAFAERHFGPPPSASAAIDLVLSGETNAPRALTLEVLLDLLLRMHPFVSEIRITADDSLWLNATLLSAAERIPFERVTACDPALEAVAFAVGPAEMPFVDANDWSLGFNRTVPAPQTNFIAGPFIGALEAAKYLFLRAVEIAYAKPIDPIEWPTGALFDVWQWRWTSQAAPAPAIVLPPTLPELALVGCGGVAAGYLWFLRRAAVRGKLLIIDPDDIEWHNMNRLPYASVADADKGDPKVASAAAFMRAGGWTVRPIQKPAEHPTAMLALEACSKGDGLVASAVGEPETRKFLARRGFARFFDAATNSDGSAQVLALHHGVSTCIDCHVRPRPEGRREGGCGGAQTGAFAGVVPHLAAYAGVILALEQLRTLLDPTSALAGANTQSIMRNLDERARVRTSACGACPYRVPSATRA